MDEKTEQTVITEVSKGMELIEELIITKVENKEDKEDANP